MVFAVWNIIRIELRLSWCWCCLPLYRFRLAFLFGGLYTVVVDVVLDAVDDFICFRLLLTKDLFRCRPDVEDCSGEDVLKQTFSFCARGNVRLLKLCKDTKASMKGII